MMQLGSFLSPKLSGVGSPPPPSPGAGGDDRCAGHFLFNICYDSICKAQYGVVGNGTREGWRQVQPDLHFNKGPDVVFNFTEAVLKGSSFKFGFYSQQQRFET